ncbi:MAG: hypothetical protein A3J07_02665 [Candidatus Doudnabacteria bacterium RIFCSPLOWO2_02_FULL_49_13]|uniref:Peptidase C39-like domain-containing protein n=1 Tax=Candidatus Doudnabacteria bacterium RIFCSPHIGHO2_12_FULL_48_16 TaxID=1817838 RepID=A0A1F5PKZ8_9BACT|nr:MAG: hypothetical protein A3B77_01310 [Candidatus Doudnabacteria bacterium RIFCSPHIGHO2_02_FULL_49_24]OGE90581.1 MAG: hypothetical protein A3E29_02180 [Candidatus Doudnabacteria bacterium RIFCSPHIGHO2_12_FULL_48_16]OGE97618.1 MAG: hypothetical protein A2990_03235 [Candidatus Doudnabacteria bacterium RIFCSPLOWO2_01_FULL_49_40]OGF02973.1 MAG: hypothetical protein A3J07_02665 [Candidatus Doudnabacteria bacterium RIFCSPLOWO2_02_FULL_49_13]OGF03548.1 MAG: hypothetical protein A3H14_00715 [Candida
MKKINLTILIMVALALAAVLIFKPKPNDQPKDQPKNETSPASQSPSTPAGQASALPGYVLLTVPFTAQAPTANWSDPRQQDGCEEASLIMAYAWTQGKTSISASEAEKTIIAMSEFEKETYGNYLDLGAADTAKLMTDYYHYDNHTVKSGITIEDIKKELAAGKLVITPANGQKLNNPNFTGAGPLTHMLVVIGYDEAKKQVITNDPGTRNGKGYRYSYNIFFNALVDYKTGYHEDQTGRPKAMIVVEK